MVQSTILAVPIISRFQAPKPDRVPLKVLEPAAIKAHNLPGHNRKQARPRSAVSSQGCMHLEVRHAPKVHLSADDSVIGISHCHLL